VYNIIIIYSIVGSIINYIGIEYIQSGFFHDRLIILYFSKIKRLINRNLLFHSLSMFILKSISFQIKKK